MEKTDQTDKKAPAKKAPAKKAAPPPTTLGQLAEIRAKLVVPKGRYSEYMGCHYRNAEDIMIALKPALLDHGCVVVLNDDIVQVGDRFYVKTTATFHGATEPISVSAFAREPLCKAKMDESQTTGSASSYAHKYALGSLFLIDDEQDSDTTSDKENLSEEFKEQLIMLNDEFLPKVLRVAMKDFGAERLSDISEADYPKFVQLCEGLSKEDDIL